MEAATAAVALEDGELIRLGSNCNMTEVEEV
jgi:hypothetical protein